MTASHNLWRIEDYAAAAEMRVDTTPEEEEASGSPLGLCRRLFNGLLLCTGDMSQLDDYMRGMSTNLMACSSVTPAAT